MAARVVGAPAEAIGAGRGDRHAGGANQAQRHRMRGDPQGHVGRPALTMAGTAGAARHDQRQRPGPEARRQTCAASAGQHQKARRAWLGHVDDQRVTGGPPLGQDAIDRRGVDSAFAPRP